MNNMEKNIEHIGFWETPKQHPFVDLKDDITSDTDESVQEFKDRYNWPVELLKEVKTIVIE